MNKKVVNGFYIIKTNKKTRIERNTPSQESTSYREGLMHDLPKENLDLGHSVNSPNPVMFPFWILERLGVISKPRS